MSPPPSAIDPEIMAGVSSIGLSDPPMKADEIRNRRKKSEKNAWGVAAMSTVEKWKTSCVSSKPPAKRWDRT